MCQYSDLPMVCEQDPAPPGVEHDPASSGVEHDYAPAHTNTAEAQSGPHRIHVSVSSHPLNLCSLAQGAHTAALLHNSTSQGHAGRGAHPETRFHCSTPAASRHPEQAPVSCVQQPTVDAANGPAVAPASPATSGACASTGTGSSMCPSAPSASSHILPLRTSAATVGGKRDASETLQQGTAMADAVGKGGKRHKLCVSGEELGSGDARKEPESEGAVAGDVAIDEGRDAGA